MKQKSAELIDVKLITKIRENLPEHAWCVAAWQAGTSLRAASPLLAAFDSHPQRYLRGLKIEPSKLELRRYLAAWLDNLVAERVGGRVVPFFYPVYSRQELQNVAGTLFKEPYKRPSRLWEIHKSDLFCAYHREAVRGDFNSGVEPSEAEWRSFLVSLEFGIPYLCHQNLSHIPLK